MPNSVKKRWRSTPFILFLLLSITMIAIIAFYQWVIGIAAFLIMGIIVYNLLKYELRLYEEMEDYISTLSHRVKKVGEETLLEMPIGIVLFNDEYQIEWANPYLASVLKEETLVGRHLNIVFEGIIALIKGEDEIEKLILNERMFRIHIIREEKLLYFFDITEQSEIERLYEEEKTVLGVIFLDNYDEVTQGMDDQTKSTINSKVISILNNWANKYGIFLKRTSSDRFIAVFNQQILQQLEKTKFDILDDVRELTSKQNVPLTLSIGIGSDSSDLPELGSLAQSSLDLALGRGGDQVAIKDISGRVKFYGGKTNPMEKRTRVRARVISHALREWVLASDKVFIMGHKAPDMDVIGAAIGILKVTEANNKEGYIVLNEEDIDSGIQRLMDEIKSKSELWKIFISPEEALEIASEHSLLVVVDTHKPSMVIDQRLLNKLDNVIVIDHHRRGEEFIENPVMVYMEPYASSTSELVTELLEYQPKTLKIDMLESTALLAGIIVDTKSFTLRTGSRTFDAASYLRSQGADTVLVQKFLKEDLEQFINRSKLIENTQIYKKGIAIAKANSNQTFGQVLIAQAADTLLSMNNVIASFVISKRQDGKISISARSLGDVNVQLIMESLNGGGHLTNAATQIEGKSIDEVEIMLKEAIDDYLEGGRKE
ncbi:MAG TPA: DHH family phosphoesterase [Bacillus bacterium]|nr:DHH family phosphoesterase [Bacillus sp. (in: firmicutes)]